MTTEQFGILSAIIIYLAATIFIGVYYSRKGSGESSDQFYLGGRRLGPYVTAMSAEASDMSAYLLMGLPGLAYFSGLAEASWTVIGLAVGTYLNWLIVAKRLRRYSDQLGAVTIPDFFSRRFGDDRHILAAIAAVVILVFFVPYTASGFSAVGKLFNSLFGVDYHVAMVVGAIIIIGYTVLGGFLAVSTTDFVQSVIMTIALLVVLGFGVNQAGGMGAVVENAKSMAGYLDLTKGYDAATGGAGSYGFLTICSTLAWGLGYFGMPHILLRFMAIRDENELKTSRRVASVWVVISMAVAILIGVVGNAVVKVLSRTGEFTADAVANLDAQKGETIIVQLSDLMGKNGLLLALVAGVILAGILAATMSTADSQLLAAASSMSQDLLQDFFGIKMKAKTSMLLARCTVIVIAVVAVLMAWDPNSSVFRVVSFAWAGFGAAFGPVMLMSLFWKRSNKWGALAGMVSGGAMVFIWKFGVAKLGGVWAIYELLPAFLVGCAVMVVVSLLTPAPEQKVVDAFERSKKAL